MPFRSWLLRKQVLFFYLNGGRPMSLPKKKAGRRAERVSALRGWCGEAIDRGLAERGKLGCQANDVVDAFVALWTAERVARGAAASIPTSPPLDGCGLRMEMTA